MFACVKRNFLPCFRGTLALRRSLVGLVRRVNWHIDYAVKLIGIDHVGISSDFDGGGGVDGWNSAAEAFDVTLELVRHRYTEEPRRTKPQNRG